MRPAWLIVFLTVFLSLYGGMHYYIYKKIAPLLPSAHVYIPWVFALFVVAPIVTQLMINANWISLARLVAAIGYTWMGFAFLYFSFALINDAIRGILWLTDKTLHLGTSLIPILSSPQVTMALMIAALAACGYGAYGSTQVNFKHVQLTTAKFAPGDGAFRIVQISDLHLGLLTDAARIQHMVTAINALHPDLVVSTGDLVDMQANHISKFTPILRKLYARYGRYAVTGNHEEINGLAGSLTFTRSAGFTLLSGEGRQIDNRVSLVGVDDPMVIRAALQAPTPEAEVLQGFDTSRVTILLKHQPVIDPASVPYFDLQLSGHIHGGQIFPFGIFTWLAYRVPMGLTRVAPETWLYVSYGSGTWGPPIRFLAPPEVTVIDLAPASNQALEKPATETQSSQRFSK